MNILQQMNQAVDHELQRLAGNEEFERLRQFYEEKREQGVAIRQEYTLPQLDTVGRDVYVGFHANLTDSKKRPQSGGDE